MQLEESSRPRLPDFVIVGTMKSGTSTLAKYLNTHGSIHVPPNELHYFDRDDNFKLGVPWYSHALMEFCPPNKDKNSLLIGEKTPTYSFQSNCIERIFHTVPNTKLIWIFRDPVKRTFSNFLHAKKKGVEMSTFRSAIAREQDGRERNIFEKYIERSMYSLQLERYLEHFHIEQMHFILYEEFVRSPQRELNRLSAFLKISSFPADLPKVHVNQTLMPACAFSLCIARAIFGHKSKFYKLARRVNYLAPRRKPKMPEDLASHLSRVFAPYNRRLSSLTGLDLAEWNRDARLSARL